MVAGVPWRVGFTVRQHDVTPTNDVTPILRARHTETGDEITAAARQDGPVGHFVVEMTFPVSGGWKWAIYPEPFAETSFETLNVVDTPGADMPVYLASIHIGACDHLGGIAYSLGEIGVQEMNVKSTQVPVAFAETTVYAPLPGLLSAGHAITIAREDTAGNPLACGDLADFAGAPAADETDTVVGLQGWDRARNVGLAVLRTVGERTAVSLYLPDATALESAPASAPAASIEIVGGATEEWAFRPRSLTIAAGETVAWVNISEIAHTITGDDLRFADSGVLDPGQAFQQTFLEPGTYRYRCGPHPWMEGVIVVE